MLEGWKDIAINAQKPPDDDDRISYDTASSQGKFEAGSSVEADEMNSPPQVENHADVLAETIGGPDQVQEENIDKAEDGNNSVTPKRRTNRILAPTVGGGGVLNTATEADDERKNPSGEDDSIKPCAQWKRTQMGKERPNIVGQSPGMM